MFSYEVFRSASAEPPLPARFERFLYNEARHLRSQSADDATTFFLKNSATGTADARLSVFERGGETVSPWRATFGGIEAAPGVPDEALHFFLEHVEAWARSRNCTTLRLVQWPAAYAPELAGRIDLVLQNRGYEPLFTEHNQHLAVVPEPLETRMHDSARRRWRKARQAGFGFQRWEHPDWAEAHAFVRAARERKGIPLSMTAPELRRLGETFPADVATFTVRAGSDLAALGVVIRLNARVLYHFLPADAEQFLAFSPTIFLNAGLHDWAFANGFELLDLGISTKQGVPNEGLLRFKRHLGAEVSAKVTYWKAFNPPPLPAPVAPSAFF